MYNVNHQTTPVEATFICGCNVPAVIFVIKQYRVYVFQCVKGSSVYISLIKYLSILPLLTYQYYYNNSIMMNEDVNVKHLCVGESCVFEFAVFL